MKPFLLLSIRAEQEAADNEYASFLRFTGLRGGRAAAGQPARRGAARRSTSTTGPASCSAVGPGTPATRPETKSAAAACAPRPAIAAAARRGGRARRPVPRRLLRHRHARACTRAAVVDRSYPEPVGPLSVTLTPEGEADPLFAGVPTDFAAYGGHKEAMGPAPRRRRAAGDVGGLPGAGVPGRPQRLRDPVPPRARPRWASAPGSRSTRTPATSDPSEAETLKARSRAVEVEPPDDGAGQLRGAHAALSRRRLTVAAGFW